MINFVKQDQIIRLNEIRRRMVRDDVIMTFKCVLNDLDLNNKTIDGLNTARMAAMIVQIQNGNTGYIDTP